MNTPTAVQLDALLARAERLTPAEADLLRAGIHKLRTAADPELQQRLEAAIQALGAAETELAALRKVARGYCPACGRGDCAPTVQDWEAERQRAERAEQEAAATATAAAHMVNLVRERAERAEAAVTRVRTIAGWAIQGWSDISPQKIFNALDEPASAAATQATGHRYLSTGCLHDQHDYCQSHTGLSGAKTPAQCKFCKAPCLCPCHQEPADA
ncbi:MAG: hypothetical protein HOY79_49335 [Streptomyces sp.]|nr:hypothetical protein [Streptomyces sp.]